MNISLIVVILDSTKYRDYSVTYFVEHPFKKEILLIYAIHAISILK
ncbi:hypothetical protein B4096_0522 [Heyndrickxia coagulans]|uniref:Uncharacterized protein n=1 Tax=Heyndrickxia coagulans TaxID=1398 RepID=A0A150KFY4_HEYCO|nr:hypothetical protein B4099_0662 [Heyndrickxia coagulans]KYC81876.1 hypothetical protein B4096_0522 [Heyndrickxia coagulans]